MCQLGGKSSGERQAGESEQEFLVVDSAGGIKIYDDGE